MSERQAPARLGEVLREMLRDTTLGERVAEAAIVPEWPDLVGPGIAAVTEPLRVSNHVLFVAVRSSPWLLELRMMEREILRRLNVGRRPSLAGIRFVIADAYRP